MFSIAYFGSPDFSGKFLEKLITDLFQLITVDFVVTQPDRPVGRKQVMTPTPVKIIANKYHLPVFENLKTQNQDCKSSIKFLNSKLKKIDIALVYAFSNIIPQQLLNIPKYGFWCIHPSLLPKYRGTSPIANTLINGDYETGVTIIKMDEKIDHGPIISQKKYKILPSDKRPDLEIALTDLAFMVFSKIINRLNNSRIKKIKTTEQNHKKATYTKKLSKQDGFIEFNKFVDLVHNQQYINNYINDIDNINNNKLISLFNRYKGLYKWPGLWTLIPPTPLNPPVRPTGSGGAGLKAPKRLKITEIKMEKEKLKILKVQLEGKKEVNFETFKKYYSFFN